MGWDRMGRVRGKANEIYKKYEDLMMMMMMMIPKTS
jgi:hypothetical protein